MVNVPAIIIGSILVFIILLILIFAFTGHLHSNPHIILIIILIGILLFAGYLILAYYKKWWPYRNILTPSNQTFNNVVLYITLAVIVITSLILAWIIYLAFKHHKENKFMYITQNKQLPVSEKEYDNETNPIIEEETKEDKMKEDKMKEGDVGLEKAEIERLALENQLQEEGSYLENGSNLEIERKIEELKQKNISQNIFEEGEELAALKEIEANRALSSTLPSREMFSEGGVDDVINRMRTVPEQLEPEVKEEMELMREEKLLRTEHKTGKSKEESKKQKEREEYEPRREE